VLLVSGLVLALVVVTSSARNSTMVAPATQTTSAAPTTRPSPTAPTATTPRAPASRRMGGLRSWTHRGSDPRDGASTRAEGCRRLPLPRSGGGVGRGHDRPTAQRQCRCPPV
jgi:hypothetical protein